jgi:hypothetical protein
MLEAGVAHPRWLLFTSWITWRDYMAVYLLNFFFLLFSHIPDLKTL